ncbi:hypothetical protein [Methylobacter sp.]|uniref:hypothetical protein n=1 Tax=Methylobacter sp. TaxID=2051955 RepID=UPI002FDCB8F7
MNALPYSGAALKVSAVHFFIGKGASGLLNLGILLWLVRLLPVAEYGVYVSLQAGMLLALAVTSLGLPWMAARYLPEFRLYASGKQLTRFVWQVVALICLFAVAGALLLFVAMPWLLEILNFTQQTDVARLYLLVLVIEGLRLNLQECILEPLLQQGQTQFSQVVRNLILLLCLGIVANQGTVHLNHVVLAELAGSFLGAAVALRGMHRYLCAHRKLSGKDGWQPPNWSEMWRTMRHMYISLIVTLTYSPSALIFLVQRFLGVEITALFGFLLNLYGQICRYLPAFLLFGLIRPKLMASYVGEGGMAQLAYNANFMGKISLFVLMPILVFVWLSGGELLSLLSGGKFTQSGYYLGGLLLTLIPFSQRQILETVAVACGQSHLCFWGSVLGALILPPVYLLLEAGHSLWIPILAIIASQILFNATLTVAMGFTTTYRPDVVGNFKLIAAALVGFILGFFVKMTWTGRLFLQGANSFDEFLQNFKKIFSMLLTQQIAVPIHGLLGLVIIAAFALGLFLLASLLFNPFRVDERLSLNRLVKRKIL